MHPRNPHPKYERLEARVTPDQKALLLRAAALEGRTLTDFIVTSAQATAHATIRRHSLLALSAHESAAFVDALLQPDELTERLRDAAGRHSALIGD